MVCVIRGLFTTMCTFTGSSMGARISFGRGAAVGGYSLVIQYFLSVSMVLVGDGLVGAPGSGEVVSSSSFILGVLFWL